MARYIYDKTTTPHTLKMVSGYENSQSIQADVNLLKSIVGKKLPAQTLEAGDTTLTFTDSSITSSSTIRPFTDQLGVVPTDAEVTTGQVVLTFDALSEDLSVYIIVC